MKKWKKEFHANMEALQRETEFGAGFEMTVVPGNMLKKLIRRGDQGDMLARRLVTSINAWFQTAEQAHRDHADPGCICCEAQIRKGWVAGWVIFLPTERERTGMVGVFCGNCFHKGAEAIANASVKHLGEHGQVMSVH